MEHDSANISPVNESAQPRRGRTPRHPYSPGMKLSDLIEADYRLLHVLSRFGLPLGFGEHSVAEWCSRHGVSESSFLTLCGVYSCDDFIPGDGELERIDKDEIVSWLHRSHEYYSEVAVPRLKGLLESVTDSCEPIHRKIVTRFFDDYCAELENHFSYEEQTVFPYVRALPAGGPAGGYNIEQFGENHSNIEEKLNDLKSILMKYLPERCESESRNDMLLELFRLEDDIHRHTVVENNILIPLVAKIENDG